MPPLFACLSASADAFVNVRRSFDEKHGRRSLGIAWPHRVGRTWSQDAALALTTIHASGRLGLPFPHGKSNDRDLRIHAKGVAAFTVSSFRIPSRFNERGRLRPNSLLDSYVA